MLQLPFLYKNKFTTSCMSCRIVDHFMVYIWYTEYIFGIIVTCQTLKIITFPVLWALKIRCISQKKILHTFEEQKSSL